MSLTVLFVINLTVGTGKSHVIVQLVISMIHQHFAKTKTIPRILICAPSNFAVDEIAYRLNQEKKKNQAKQPHIKRKLNFKASSMVLFIWTCSHLIWKSNPWKCLNARFDGSFHLIVVRVGVSESMHENVKEISVDCLAERFHKYQCADKFSPESNQIATINQELKVLRSQKTGICNQLMKVSYPSDSLLLHRFI